MADEIKLNITGLSNGFQRVWKRVPQIAGSKARTFFVQSFRRQGWVEDGKIDKWDPRKGNKDRGRKVLIKSGRLWRDIRVLHADRQFVQVGTTVPYAEAHNEGANITGPVMVPGFMRKAHSVKSHKRKGSGKIKAHRRRASKVSTHRRNMNTKLPRRQFIGESPDVIKSIEREVFRALDDVIRNV